MINRNSKSYPYLAIAEHYNVPYVEVLEYADSIKGLGINTTPPFIAWRLEVWLLENDK